MTVSKAPVVEIPVDDVVVGLRRRQSLGRLQSLQNSIGEHGLIHPILVRDGNQLVSGARRLEACKRLGWKKILARHVDRISDDELRAIELDENIERLDLLDFEASKARLAEMRQAEADLKREAAEAQARMEVSRPLGEKPTRKGGAWRRSWIVTGRRREKHSTL